MILEQQLQQLLSTLGDLTTLVAVSKTFPAEDIVQANQMGLTNFGENRVQDFLAKYESLQSYNLVWHFIGHLQRNKVKQLIGKIDLLHSLDSIKLYQKIVSEAGKQSAVLPCLLQLNVSDEVQKNGIPVAQLDEVLDYILANPSSGCPIMGLMCIGSSPLSANKGQIDAEFDKMYSMFCSLKDKQSEFFQMKYLSMGMSHDYQQAIEHGSNMVRIGSAIFGSRS